MQQLIIDRTIVISILEKMFSLLLSTKGNCAGCIGIFSTTIPSPPVLFSYGAEHHLIQSEELKKYLEELQQQGMQTSLEHPTFPPSVPSAITACRIGEYIVAAHTPAGDPWDQAVTILYGTYHSLVQKEKTKEGLHDLFVDRLLISVGRTNGERSLPNPVLVRLAQQVFKPEISMHE